MQEKKETIVILNALPDGSSKSEFSFLDQIAVSLEQKGRAVTIINLAEQNIHFCTGCWTCWWTTPGRCIFNDDMDAIYRQIISADQVIYFSAMAAGYVNTLTKKVMDRTVALIHPYIEVVEGECHHRRRYDHYPRLALIVQEEEITDMEDLEMMKEFMSRLALNSRSSCDYVHSMTVGIEEICNETCYA